MKIRKSLGSDSTSSKLIKHGLPLIAKLTGRQLAFNTYWSMETNINTEKKQSMYNNQCWQYLVVL